MATIDLVDLQRQARHVGCTLVTKEAMEDFARMSARLRDAETKLREQAALRLVAERNDWRGRLARRWISRTQSGLDVLSEVQRGYDA